MATPAFKRSSANNFAKLIRDTPLPNKDVWVDFIARFFSKEDPFFRGDIFYNVATATLESDPAIKNPTGRNGK
jgi:hypothetical protein